MGEDVHDRFAPKRRQSVVRKFGSFELRRSKFELLDVAVGVDT